jgi:hypothetical protein
MRRPGAENVMLNTPGENLLATDGAPMYTDESQIGIEFLSVFIGAPSVAKRTLGYCPGS